MSARAACMRRKWRTSAVMLLAAIAQLGQLVVAQTPTFATAPGATATVAYELPPAAANTIVTRRCQTAVTAQRFLFNQLRECMTARSSSNPFCRAFGEAVLEQQRRSPADDPTTALLVGQQDIQSNWLAILARQAVTYSAAGAAELSDVTWALQHARAAWQVLAASSSSSGSSRYGGPPLDQFLDAWLEPWRQLSNGLLAAAADPRFPPAVYEADVWTMHARRTLYLQMGQWPLPTSPAARQAAKEAAAVFAAAMKHLPLKGERHHFFSAPFNNGTAVAHLQALFVTPDPSRPVPVIVIMAGADRPKEGVFLLHGLDALRRGFGVVVFDGPGQGELLQRPPWMPVSGSADRLVAALLGTMRSDPFLAGACDVKRVVLLGIDLLGGWLAGKACAGLGTQVAACILSPAVLSVPRAFLDPWVRFAYQPMAAAIATSQQIDPAALRQQGGLSMEARAAFSDPQAQILTPLLWDCAWTGVAANASTGRRLFFDILYSLAQNKGGLEWPLEPGLAYVSASFAGRQASDYQGILHGAVEGYRSMLLLQTAPAELAGIRAPVLVFQGTHVQAATGGGQEQEWFDALMAANPDPDVRRGSQLVSFAQPALGSSGATAMGRGGTLHDKARVMYGWLSRVLPGGLPPVSGDMPLVGTFL